jgi:dipeptidyl aminopeptidase/acylaminoacyl peptidase
MLEPNEPRRGDPMSRPLRVLLAMAFLALGAGVTPAQAGAGSVVNGRIAFNADRDGNGEIYRMNTDGSGQTNLTNDPGDDYDSAWSFDGRRLAFTTTRDGNGEIYVMNGDGSAQTNISNNSAYDLLPTWSPDGTKITFVSNRGGTFDIWVMNADGSGPTNLTDGDGGSWPAWSPDGSKIAFESDRDGDYDIYVMNAADGSGVTNVTNTSEWEREAVWSPDGTRLAFLSGGDVWVMNLDGSGGANLTQTAETEYSPDWSPDGTKIVYEREVGSDLEIYAMNAAGGSAQTDISNNPESDSVPVWQPAPVSVPKTRVKEGRVAKFRLELAVPAGGVQSLAFEAVNGSAKRGKDFKATTGSLELITGQIKGVIKVKTRDDQRDERKERFFLELTLPSGALVRAKAVIKDND